MAQISLTLHPSARYDAIDVRKRLASQFGDLLQRYRKTIYCSLHTTAGYLDHSLAARLNQHDRLAKFFGAFRTLFPPNAPYQHDRLELRSELTEQQKEVEPRNADSHLTFIGSGLSNCVTRFNQRVDPVYFIELDGENEGTRRERSTTLVAYDREEVALRASIAVPVSHHPVDSINLADPRLGFLDEVEALVRKAEIEKGRVDLTLAPAEPNAGLTVNEYETLLMKHDLVEVLRNPLKFAALKSRHMIADPRAIPHKTLDYAKYDLVHVFNSLMEAFGFDHSAVERLLSRLIAVPARRFLRMKRRVSFLASDESGPPRIVRGRYQSPILVQWRPASGQTRHVEVTLVRLR